MYRDVRQDDTISLKLFILALENVFKNLNWDGREINIDGSYLNNLRFADDIVLLSNNISELKNMEQLNNATKKVGLKMNLNKIQIMSNNQEIIEIDNYIINATDQYLYLGHAIRIGKENQSAEISRRIGLS